MCVQLTPVFAQDFMFNKLVEILESWKGTKYRHLTGVKGRGADCSLYLAHCFLELGLLTKIEHDYYSRDWHIHTKNQLVRDGFTKHLSENMAEGHTGFYTDTDADPMRGDLVGFSMRCNGITNHVACYIGDGICWHSIEGRGVSTVKLEALRRMGEQSGIFRVYTIREIR